MHVVGIGTGVVRETRNAGRYLIEIKGRTMVAAGGQLEAAAPAAPAPKAREDKHSRTEDRAPAASVGAITLDLHAMTAGQAIEAVDECLNDAILDGCHEVRVIHGRSGGRLKAAVHKRLRQLPSVRSFRIDPRNPGVTIVVF